MATLQWFYFVIPYLPLRIVILQKNTYPDFTISEIYYIKDPTFFIFCDITRAELEKQLPQKKGRMAAKRK